MYRTSYLFIAVAAAAAAAILMASFGGWTLVEGKEQYIDRDFEKGRGIISPVGLFQWLCFEGRHCWDERRLLLIFAL